MATKKSSTSSKKPTVKKIEKKPEVKEEVTIKKEEKVLDKPIEIKEEKKELKPIKKLKKHTLVNIIVILLLIFSIISFGFIVLNKSSSIMSLISSLLLTVFVICFSVVSITYKRNSKSMILISSLLLIGYFILGFINTEDGIISISVPNFSGKSITEVMKWASKNSITVNQEYEYSDMVPEYRIISQEEIKKNNKLSELNVAVSEGANPSKEIIVPSMIGWDTERVLKFIKSNYLSNVFVEFIQSDMAKDTVINQSASGNLKRDDELKLTFSYGEELDTSEVSLIDFTNKSKFEVEFYMKQHQLKYKFEEEFSSKVKRGYATKQNIAAGEKVNVNDTEVIITISKGPEIKVPDLKKYSITEITEWAINNKVKLNFSDSYDDTVKKNNIISTSVNEGDIIEQGTIVKVVLSRGNLKMPEFESIEQFYEWANKYNVKYEEQHEFSDTVESGKVISYSYKAGSIIKNGDSIRVVISDGAKRTVPSVVGLSKNNACGRLEDAGLGCSVSYRNSTESKDKVLSQSISAGSEVSNGTTVVIGVSNGKAPYTPPAPQPTPTPQPKCDNVTVYIYDELIKQSNPEGTCSSIKNRYSSLKFSCTYVSTGRTNGLLVNSDAVDGKTFSTCDTITLKIERN